MINLAQDIVSQIRNGGSKAADKAVFEQLIKHGNMLGKTDNFLSACKYRVDTRSSSEAWQDALMQAVGEVMTSAYLKVKDKNWSGNVAGYLATSLYNRLHDAFRLKYRNRHNVVTMPGKVAAAADFLAMDYSIGSDGDVSSRNDSLEHEIIEKKKEDERDEFAVELTENTAMLALFAALLNKARSATSESDINAHLGHTINAEKIVARVGVKPHHLGALISAIEGDADIRAFIYDFLPPRQSFGDKKSIRRLQFADKIAKILVREYAALCADKSLLDKYRSIKPNAHGRPRKDGLLAGSDAAKAKDIAKAREAKERGVGRSALYASEEERQEARRRQNREWRRRQKEQSAFAKAG